MVHDPQYARIITPAEVGYVEAHYRTTHFEQTTTQALAQGIAIFAEGTRRQLAHTHVVTDLTRFGEGICHGCGLNMWSPAWVAEGVFGELGTPDYIRERLRSWTEMVNRDRLRFDLPQILASLLDEEPARMTVDIITQAAV
jgi:hypothetical protein